DFPGAGSPLTWNPALTSIPTGSSGAGTLLGFWSGDAKITGDAGAATASGQWSDNTTHWGTSVRRKLVVPFTAGGASGTVSAAGSIVDDIQPAQFGADDEVYHGNNVVVWQGLWIPALGAIRTVNWAVALGSHGYLGNVAASDHYYNNGY